MAKTEPPDELVWETPPPGPPPGAHKGSKWDPIARALKHRPGQWACIGRGIPTSIITTINKGELKCFRPEGSFEAVARNHRERWVADVYVRYVGEEQGKA